MNSDQTAAEKPAEFDRQQRRRELAEFLRARRESISPEVAGVAQRRRRRTPGLRREEVALLADIGSAWYSRLEMAHEVTPSTETLLAIARALRLSPVETEFVFELAGLPVPKRLKASRATVPQAIQQLVPGIEDVGAVVWDAYLTPILWNSIGGALFDISPSASAIERNMMVRIPDPYYVAFFGADYERMVETGVGMFRRVYTLDEGAAEAQQVYEAAKGYPLFQRFWKAHRVAEEPTVTAGPFVRHPSAVGTIRIFTSDMFGASRSDWFLRIMAPADEESAQKFKRLRRMGSPSSRNGSP